MANVASVEVDKKFNKVQNSREKWPRLQNVILKLLRYVNAQKKIICRRKTVSVFIDLKMTKLKVTRTKFLFRFAGQSAPEDKCSLCPHVTMMK